MWAAGWGKGYWLSGGGGGWEGGWGVGGPGVGGGGRGRSSGARWGRLEAGCGEGVPAVAEGEEPGGDVLDVEVGGVDVVGLVPAQRGGDAGPIDGAWRVCRGQRGGAAVHVVVQEDLAGSGTDGPVNGDLVGVGRQDAPGKRFRDCADRVVVEGSGDRNVQVQSRPAGRLDERVQAD